MAMGFNQSKPNMHIKLRWGSGFTRRSCFYLYDGENNTKVEAFHLWYYGWLIYSRQPSNQQLGYTSIFITLHFQTLSYSKLHNSKAADFLPRRHLLLIYSHQLWNHNHDRVSWHLAWTGLARLQDCTGGPHSPRPCVHCQNHPRGPFTPGTTQMLHPLSL